MVVHRNETHRRGYGMPVGFCLCTVCCRFPYLTGRRPDSIARFALSSLLAPTVVACAFFRLSSIDAQETPQCPLALCTTPSLEIDSMSEVAVAPTPQDRLPPREAPEGKPPASETPLSPSSVEHRYERTETAEDDDEDLKTPEEPGEEGAKEEDELFTSIEKEQEGQEITEQPSEVTAAPRLLQKALTAGDVKDDSDEEEKKDSGDVTEAAAPKEDEGKTHIHQRVSMEHRQVDLYFILFLIVSPRTVRVIVIVAHEISTSLIFISTGKSTRILVK